MELWIKARVMRVVPPYNARARHLLMKSRRWVQADCIEGVQITLPSPCPIALHKAELKCGKKSGGESYLICLTPRFRISLVACIGLL